MINADMNELILRLLDVKLTGTGTIHRLLIPERTGLDRPKREFELLWNGTINELSILDAFVQYIFPKANAPITPSEDFQLEVPFMLKTTN